MTMTKDEYREAIEGLGVTSAEFGRLIGVDARSERRWALGERRLPGPVILLIRLFQARPELLAVARKVEPAPVRTRGKSKAA